MGEALVRKGDLQAATGKFGHANEAAPAWGKNQLRWGEALLKAGREHDARSHFERARALYLSAADRAELDALPAPAGKTT